jgi:hypothetical protein
MKWIIPNLLLNCRDIGGLLTKDGHHIKYRKIIRSASLSKFSQEDIEVLKNYQVASIVDLRAKGQAEIKKDTLWRALNISIARFIKQTRLGKRHRFPNKLRFMMTGSIFKKGPMKAFFLIPLVLNR